MTQRDPARQVDPVALAGGATPNLVTIQVNGVCPWCGAGKGRPHFERCQVPPADYPRMPGGQELSGLVAYAIGVFPVDVVRRSTIRAMLPRGRATPRPAAVNTPGSNKKTRNHLSVRFGEAIADFHHRRWITRTDDAIIIRARVPLLQYAGRKLERAPELITALRGTLQAVADSLPSEITVEGRRQRDRELWALRQLMEDAPASGPHGDRGYVIVRGARP